MHLARVSRNNVLYIFFMVEPVGIEPTVFLMSLIYSQLPSPLGTRLQIEFKSSSTHIIGTIHLIIQGRQGLGTPLGILVQRVYIAAGVLRPPLFYTVKPFEEAYNSVTFSC